MPSTVDDMRWLRADPNLPEHCAEHEISQSLQTCPQDEKSAPPCGDIVRIRQFAKGYWGIGHHSFSRLFDRIFVWIRLAAPYRLFWLGGPVLLYCWTLGGPFLSDDMNLILKSERYIRGDSNELELYRFAKSDEAWNDLRDRGTIPWWVSEKGRLDFFRPLSEYVFYLDVRLFGRNPLGHRLTSLVFFALALLATHWMFCKVGADLVRAGAATFFFGISQTATPPVTWVCNRSDLLVVLGVTLTAGCYWSSCNRPRWWNVPVAATAYFFALLSKEVAVAMCAVIVAHELILRRRASSRFDRPMAGLLAVILVVITVGYLLYYRSTRPQAFELGGGDGTQNQLTSSLLLWILHYAAVWTIGFPIDVLPWATKVQMWLVAGLAGCLTIIVVSYFRKSVRGDQAALFFALWAIVFVLPSLRSQTGSTRNLCTASLGWSYLLVGLILPSREEDVIIPSPLRHWYFTANGAVSIGCMIGTVLFMNQSELQSQRTIQKILADSPRPLADGHALVSIAADSNIGIICGGDRLEFMTGLRNVSLLHLLPVGIEYDAHIEDARTVTLRAKNESLFGTAIHAHTLPKDWKPRVGQTFQLRNFSAEITEVRGNDFVSALRFRFNEPLDSPRLHFHPPGLFATAPRLAAPRHSDTRGLAPCGAEFVPEQSSSARCLLASHGSSSAPNSPTGEDSQMRSCRFGLAWGQGASREDQEKSINEAIHLTIHGLLGA